MLAEAWCRAGKAAATDANDASEMALRRALTVFGIRIAWWCFSQVRRSADEEGGRTIDRSYFMSLVGLGLNGLAAIYILTTGIIPYLMGACE